MPAPLSLALRQRILAMLEQNTSPAAIARKLDLCPRTVRHLCGRLRRDGKAALEPSYVSPELAKPSAAIEKALLLHQEHVSWGAAFVLHMLEHTHADVGDLPSARTLQRWFRREEVPAAPPGRKPASHGPTAERAHEVWQMDAVEQVKLKTHQQVSWVRWVDECSGATLGTVVFPPRDVRPGAGDRGPRRSAPAI